jgi:hypothetical protein
MRMKNALFSVVIAVAFVGLIVGCITLNLWLTGEIELSLPWGQPTI